MSQVLHASVFVNKVLVEHSKRPFIYILTLVACALQQRAGELLKECMAFKVQNIYYLAPYRKSLLTLA